MTSKLHIIHLPRTFPSKLNPLSGIFFKEQVDAICRDKNIRIGVLAIIQRPLLSKIFFLNCPLWLHPIKLDQDNSHQWLVYLFTLPMPFKIKRWYVNYRCFLMAKKYISIYGKPDLIHLQTYEMGSAALLIKKKLNIPYIITEHSSNLYSESTRLDKNLLLNIYSQSCQNIAVSPYFANFLSNKFATPFKYIPNSVNLEKFTLKRENRSNIKNLLHVAHCVPIKQQDLLLRGFQKALLTNSNLQLTVVGDGPELGKLKELSKKLAIQKKVCFKGKQTNEDVSKEMQKADIFILTSKRETFGVVLIEAMAVGLPCISTKSGGPEDILVNEDLGILCDQNSKAVCNAIIKAVKIEYNSESIRYHVSKTYSAEVVGTKIRSVYSKVITPQKNV